MENNKVNLIGTINQEPVFDHLAYDECFYKIILKIERKSDNFDLIPVLVSERLIDLSLLKINTKIQVIGKFNSFNKHEETKASLILYVFAKEVKLLELDSYDYNLINLKGYICKAPSYRKTPLGREITDILIAVNRNYYNKSDYIPCIVWGRNARHSSNYNIGNCVCIEGRVQSREYIKQYNDKAVTKIAYEVSISRISIK